MSCAIADKAPAFRAYAAPACLDLIKRVYDLNPVAVATNQTRVKIPTFFCSAKPFRRKDVFLLPFQYLRSLDIGTESDNVEFFAQLQTWSARTERNISLQTLEHLAHERVQVVATNPVLFLPEDKKALWSGYSRNLRTNLKRNANKADRIGLRIESSSCETDLSEFYRCVLAPQYVKRHRMVFQPYTLFHGLWALGVLRLVIARLNGRIVGGLLLVKDDQGVHYAWGATEAPERLALGMLLLHREIEHAVERRLSWFDFGSTPLSDADLLAFKLRWGSTGFPVRRYYTLREPTLTDLNSSFGLARHAYSHLPPSWARAMMPHVVPWLVR